MASISTVLIVVNGLCSPGIAVLLPILRMGHVSLATTDRYLAHIAPKQVIETMAKREWEP